MDRRADEWITGPFEPEPHTLLIEEEAAGWRLRYVGTEGKRSVFEPLFPTLEAAVEKAGETVEQYRTKGYPEPGCVALRTPRQ